MERLPDRPAELVGWFTLELNQPPHGYLLDPSQIACCPLVEGGESALLTCVKVACHVSF